MPRYIGVIALCTLWASLPHGAQAEPLPAQKPSWSLEAKGGQFTPAAERWSDYYRSDTIGQFATSIAFKPLRFIDIGMEAQHVRATGHGVLPLNNAVGARVVYELFPLNVSLTVRGIFYEEQWVVPYIGGGWTRVYYKEQIQSQSDITGSVDGNHVRAGLQLLLDRLDRADAASMKWYGIDNTYLIVEAQRTIAKEKTANVDVGGRSYLVGLLFEF